MRHMIQAIAAADGIAIGPALVLRQQEITLDRTPIPPIAAQWELDRFTGAVSSARRHLEGKLSAAQQATGRERAELVAVHLSILQDPLLEETIVRHIRDGGKNALCAIADGTQELVALFQALSDPYLRQRADDVGDVGRRILEHAAGVARVELNHLPADCILVARDLSPAETVSLDLGHTLGLVTELGGRTSHTAILARSLGLPAVVGAPDLLHRAEDGALLILDGGSGIVILDPTLQQLEQYRREQALRAQQRQTLDALHDLPAQLLGGPQIQLCANIASPAEVPAALQHGAEGVGLFRTEFLFMDANHLPTEEEQFSTYRAVAEGMGRHRPVTIRTLDVGGDKALPYFPMPKEENPFLGWRAIRICLDRPEILRTQLRAILRASAFGHLRVLYPMIISLDEVLAANALLNQCAQALRQENQPFDPELEVGVLVETPSAVLLADVLAAHVDFFSIGTNDLCQYILAVDRGNPYVAKLYDPLHPAVLRAIHAVVDAAHRAGRWVGVCGELGGDPQAVSLLAGLGVDGLSMAAPAIPQVKARLRDLSMADALALAQAALAAPDLAQVRRLLADT